MIVPTVLLADADPDSRTVYGLILQHYGFQVLAARQGEKAFRLARERRPDLIIADLFLPCGDGQPITAALKQEPRTRDLAVIGLTSVPASTGRVPGLMVCDSYLLKPCTPTRLLREVQRILARTAPLRDAAPVVLGTVSPLPRPDASAVNEG